MIQHVTTVSPDKLYTRYDVEDGRTVPCTCTEEELTESRTK